MTATAIGSYATGSALKTRAGITDSTDDTLLGLICDQVNQYIESRTGRVIAPISGTAIYYYDGDGDTSLFLPLPVSAAPIGGLRSIALLEFAAYTGAAYETIVAGDYFLRQRVGMTGPYERLVMSDVPTGSYSAFPRGRNTVRATSSTAGWAAIPDDITDVALTAATRAWFARQSGQQDIVGSDELGQPLISRFFSARDFGTLRAYSLVDGLF